LSLLNRVEGLGKVYARCLSILDGESGKTSVGIDFLENSSGTWVTDEDGDGDSCLVEANISSSSVCLTVGVSESHCKGDTVGRGFYVRWVVGLNIEL